MSGAARQVSVFGLGAVRLWRVGAAGVPRQSLVTPAPTAPRSRAGLIYIRINSAAVTPDMTPDMTLDMTLDMMTLDMTLIIGSSPVSVEG
jgi:hypothetical protein